LITFGELGRVSVTVKRLRKQVRFYEIVAIDGSDDVVEIEPTFWTDLHDHLQKLAPSDRRTTFHGAKYAGFPRQAIAPAQDYLLFGHVRDKADWPHAYDEVTGDFRVLTGPAGIAEPTYLLDVPRTNVVAMLGTTKSTHVSAVEAWLAHVTDNIRWDHALQLLPVLDTQTAQKLQRASGVTAMTIRLPKGVDIEGLHQEGDVGAALAQATVLTLGDMEVEMTWSIGRSRAASQIVISKMLRGLRSVVGGRVSVAKVRASLTLTDDDGREYTEKVDFIKQRVAYPVQFDVDADDAFSEESALRGMLRAIDRYRDEMM
jgi:hypothetical protein